MPFQFQKQKSTLKYMPTKIRPLSNPYTTRGNWYKAAFHIHTTNSDGKVTPRQAVARYRARGYKIVGISDHGFVTRLPQKEFPGVLLVPNVEVSWPHLLLIGTKARGKVDYKTPRKAMAAGRRDGAFVVFCHPEWSNHPWKVVLGEWPVDAVETYNHGCEYENATGYGDMHWNLLLREGRKIWGFADDDSHWTKWSPEYDGGWIAVRAPRLTVPAVLKALKSGSYYSSQGPRLLDLKVRGKTVVIKCSPVREVRAVAEGVGAGAVQFSGKPKSTWVFDRSKFMWKETRWVRFEIKDSRGKKAWSNPLFVK